MNTGIARDAEKPPLALNILLWLAQFWVGACLIMIGYTKLSRPIAELASMWVWPGQYSELVRIMGVIDITGGVGIVLPFLTRIRPGLGVLAAAGCTLLQVCAMIFHASRGEFAALPINVLLLLPSTLVLWGRRKYPILPRA